jgi:hypothetical protein
MRKLGYKRRREWRVGEKRGSGYRVERSTGVGVEHAGPAWDRLPGKEGRQWEIQRTVRQRI